MKKKYGSRRRTKIVRRSKKNLRRTIKRKSLGKGRRRPTRRHSRIQRGGGNYYEHGRNAEIRSDKGSMLSESTRKYLYNTAMDNYTIGANGKDSDSIGCAYRLGRMYDKGKEQYFKQDKEKAFEWYTAAVVNGDAQPIHSDSDRNYIIAAQNRLGYMYYAGQGVAQDYAEAARLYGLAAEQGHAASQFDLGTMFENGEGVAQNDAEAVRLYGLAAAQGHANAQNSLGYMYYAGEGVAQNDAEAVRLYGLAAAQGHANAQFNLGFMFDKGRGVAQDYAEAARLYGLAAEKGHADAQYNLGNMYHEGEGVAQNYAEAARLYGLAAEKGHADAQYNLGNMYHEGKGVAQNYAEAKKWYHLAGSEQAKARLVGLVHVVGS
jgi:TPR repeat protein